MSDWQQISAGLSAQFPRSAVHWRAQSVTQDGSKGLALAYIDARDVMERLDEIAGPENWQDSYVETPKGRLICTLSIRCGDEWIAKSDGAGDTDVEGDKGAISDALKRAAVKWGVGRYLYDMPATWVPCESYKAGEKWRWRKWKDGVDPWSFVRNADFAGEPTPRLPQHDNATEFRTRADAAQSDEGLMIVWNDMVAHHGSAELVPAYWRDWINKRKRQLREQMAEDMAG